MDDTKRILEIELTGFAEEFHTGTERNRGIKHDFQVFVFSNKVYNKMVKTEGEGNCVKKIKLGEEFCFASVK